MLRTRGISAMLSAVVIVGGTSLAIGQTVGGDDPIQGNNTLTAASAADYDKVIFTDTTPERSVAELKDAIIKLERGAAEALDSDQSESSAQEEAASYSDKAAYLKAVLDLICRQESPAGC
jgi:hypothetical protein